MRYCQAGANHIWLRNNNKAQLCCSINQVGHSYDLDKTEHFINLINSQDFKDKYAVLETGPIPSKCDICINNEKNINDSQRIKINRLSDNGNKFFLKIDFSNKCNLKCIMCSSSRSTAWIKDEQKMNNLGYSYHIEEYSSLGNNWWQNIELSWWKNLGAVEISGGEPLYQQEAIEFLDFLSCNVPDIQLKIITNATLVDTNIIKIFKKFSDISILCSVDAWDDDIYAYSRGGSYSLDDVKQVITTLYKNVNSLNICDTIHCITYDQAEKGKQWIKQNNLNNIRHHTNYVYSPRYLNVHSVLPTNIFPQGIKDNELQNYFIKWIKNLDTVRGTNILKVRPEFEEWFYESTKSSN